MERNQPRLARAPLAAAIALASLPALGFAACPETFTVNTTADTIDAEDGKLSLREAIAAAEANGVCEGTDTIEFALKSGAVINIESSSLNIYTDDVHIDGSTAGAKGIVLTSSITAGSFFAVTYEGGVPDVSITGVTFDGENVARSGNTIYFSTNGGGITLKDVVVQNINTTEGSPVHIEYSQPVVIEDSVFTGNSTDGSGGALYFGSSEGTAAVVFTRTTLAENEAYDGGAVYFLGNSVQALFDQSAVVNNTATHAGGGIYNSGATLELVNSTVSGNSANGEGSAPAGFGGGIFQYNSNDIELNSVTITDNTAASYGGGIAGYEVNIDVIGNGNVVAANTAGAAGNEDFSVSGSNVTSELTNSFTSADGDPLLKALAFNGGPTPNHMPQKGSPLRDALEEADYTTAPTIDQTGRDRPLGAGYDIGAVEYRDTSGDGGGVAGFGLFGLLALLGLRRRR